VVFPQKWRGIAQDEPLTRLVPPPGHHAPVAQSSDRKGDHGGFGTRPAWNLDAGEHVYGHVDVVVDVKLSLN
jgi:hypothetical protein